MLRILPLTSAYYKNYYIIINIKPFLCGHILKKFIGQLHYFLSNLSDRDSLLQRRKVHALVLVHSPQRRNNITVPDVALQSFFSPSGGSFFLLWRAKTDILLYWRHFNHIFSLFWKPELEIISNRNLWMQRAVTRGLKFLSVRLMAKKGSYEVAGS